MKMKIGMLQVIIVSLTSGSSMLTLSSDINHNTNIRDEQQPQKREIQQKQKHYFRKLTDNIMDPKTVELKNEKQSKNDKSRSDNRGGTNQYSLKHMERLLKNETLFYEDERSKNSTTTIYYTPSKASTSESKIPYRLHFVTYSDENMRNTRERLVRQAQRSGWFTSVVGYSPMDLPPEFQHEFQAVLELKRGAGYWIWRFPVLEMMLDRIPFGDYFVFLDAGFTLNRKGKAKLLNWLETLQNSEYDEMGFQIHELEHQYTTNRIFNAFQVPVDDLNIRNSGQIQGGVLIMRNGPRIRENLSAIYQILASDPFLITDKYNEEAKGLDPEFVDNRHDQSLHSVTQKIHGSVVIPWQCDDAVPFRNFYLRQMSDEDVMRWEQDDMADKTPW